MSEKQRIISTIYALGQNFNQEVKPELLAVWTKLAIEQPIEIFESACWNVIKNYKFKTLPPYAVIQDEISKILGKTEEDNRNTAVMKWEQVLEKIRSCGSYGEPRFDAITSRLVKSFGGWQTMCQWEEKNLDFRRKEFIENYVVMQNIAQTNTLALEKIKEKRKQLFNSEQENKQKNKELVL